MSRSPCAGCGDPRSISRAGGWSIRCSFFCSSRRRHTRSLCDWSSDVCSSDLTGTLEYAPGAEAAFSIDLQRPDKVHYDFTLQGMTQMQGFDGKIGWGNDPFSGKRDAEPLAEDDLKDIQEQADFGFPLVSYKDKGYKLEYVGVEPVEGSDAYKVKITPTNGDEIFYYLDTDYFLEIREEV